MWIVYSFWAFNLFPVWEWYTLIWSKRMAPSYCRAVSSSVSTSPCRGWDMGKEWWWSKKWRKLWYGSMGQQICHYRIYALQAPYVRRLGSDAGSYMRSLPMSSTSDPAWKLASCTRVTCPSANPRLLAIVSFFVLRDFSSSSVSSLPLKHFQFFLLRV